MYHHVFVGGTFDRLHKGHEIVIETAFHRGQRVTIGLTSDDFVSRFKAKHQKIRSYNERRGDLIDWLTHKQYLDRADIVPIDDPHDPAAIGSYDALIVTRDNRFRGEEINVLRQNRGLPALTIIDVPIVSASDGQPISSSRVRSGEIDVQGQLTMPEGLRAILGQPLGDILTGPDIVHSLDMHRDDLIIAVGDVTTKTITDVGIMPALTIIDLHVGRKPFAELADYRFAKDTQIVKVKSGPGHISQDAVTRIKNWLTDNGTSKKPDPLVLLVAGEEDLLALPVIVFAPLGSVMYYGQPAVVWKDSSHGSGREGLVEVVITEHKKREASIYLNQFISE